MHLFRSLKPPRSDADRRETFRWIRRCEIFGGIYAIAIGLALWNAGWWHWIPIGLGLYGIAPLGGATSLVRKAERDPGVFVTDPERQRRRANRFLLLVMPFYVIFGAVIGFLLGGLGAAIFIGLLMAVGGAVGVVVARRRMRAR